MKAHFLRPPEYRDLSTQDRPLWFRLLREFTFVSKTLKGSVTVPRGFECDGRSSPWIIWNIVPPVGPAIGPAIIHDWLYKSGAFSRKKADMVFREALIVMGFSKFRAWINYRVLRLLGGIAWRKHRRADVAAMAFKNPSP